MNVSLHQKYLQIVVEDDNAFLHKAIAYAEKYFSKSYRLSRTVLILDDGERLKKDYLINWAYHVCLQGEQNKAQSSEYVMPDLEYLLNRTSINCGENCPFHANRFDRTLSSIFNSLCDISSQSITV